jgi:hypothetical protein
MAPRLLRAIPSMTMRTLQIVLPLILLLGCGPSERPGDDETDLPLGDGVDLKADGDWGPYATQCKAIPTRPALVSPRITVSISGLTLHLYDDATGFSRVYPIGVGAINHAAGELTADRSLSLFPVLATKSTSFTIKTSKVDPCKVWWTDPETKQKAPVFAGLPFLPWYGSYGIHGPITEYQQQNGGKLQRGYVSHGCIRMEAADVAELWAYVRKVSQVPVTVQAELERASSGLAVDLPQRWILSECTTNADCNYSGGVCLPRPGSTRGFCSAACNGLCNYDKYGYPVTFCVPPASVGRAVGTTTGFCTNKSSDFDDSCRRYDGFRSASNEPRFSQPSVKSTVCLPKL